MPASMPHKPHKFEAEGDFIEHLEGERRRKRLPLEDILPRMEISKSDLVIDLGPGTGYFTFPIAKLAGDVIGIDIEEKMLEILKKRIRENGVDDLAVLHGDMSRLPIADSTVDHALAAFVYHEVADQTQLMAECARVLKRGGRLTVIDFQKRLELDGPPIWVRKSPRHVQNTAAKWFTLVSTAGSKDYYQLTFSRNQVLP